MCCCDIKQLSDAVTRGILCHRLNLLILPGCIFKYWNWKLELTRRPYMWHKTVWSSFQQEHLQFSWATRVFWKHLSLLSYNVKHQNQSKQLIASTASVWVILSRLLKRYQCSGDGWKLQEESVELNCWQQESQYISRSSNWLLFLHDIPTVLELNC